MSLAVSDELARAFHLVAVWRENGRPLHDDKPYVEIEPGDVACIKCRALWACGIPECCIPAPPREPCTCAGNGTCAEEDV